MNLQEQYAVFPLSDHEKQVRNYFEAIGGERGHNRVVAEKSLFLGFTNRCGSTMIASELSAAGLFSEPSNSLNYEYFNSEEVISTCREKNLTSFICYTKHLIETHTGPAGWFASKIACDQLVWLTRTGLIGRRFRNPAVIFSTRRNLVAQAVSLSIATQTNRWTSSHADMGFVAEYRPTDIIRFLEVIVRANSYFELFFQLHGITPIRLVYEDVIEQPDLILSKTGAALGIELTRARTRTLKVERQASAINLEWEERFRAEYSGQLENRPLLI